MNQVAEYNIAKMLSYVTATGCTRAFRFVRTHRASSYGIPGLLAKRGLYILVVMSSAVCK